MCLGDTGQYTCVSSKGKSVVDYTFVPHEQMHFWKGFKVHLITDTIMGKSIPHPEKRPDHSLLTWDLLLSNKLQVQDTQPSEHKHMWYKLKNTTKTFVDAHNDEVKKHTQNIENKLEHLDMLDEAYADLKCLLNGEMDSHL